MLIKLYIKVECWDEVKIYFNKGIEVCFNSYMIY